MRLWPLISLLLLVGCNGDIFINDDQGPVDYEAVIASGEAMTINYQRKDLQSMTLWLPYYDELNDPNFGVGGFLDDPDKESSYPTYDRADYAFVCRFYDESGLSRTSYLDNGGDLSLFSMAESTPALKKLTVENSFVGLELEFQAKNQMRITNLYNLTDSAFKYDIWSSYGYKGDVVMVTAESTMTTSTHKFVVTGIDYGEDVWCRESYLRDTIPFEAVNREDVSVKVEFPIAEHCRTYVDFRINPYLSGLFSDSQPDVELEIPTYGYGDDAIGRCGMYGVTVPFSWHTVVLPGLDSAFGPDLVEYGWTFDKVYTFQLSPKVGVKAELYVSRLNIRADAKLRARNVDSGHELWIPVKVWVNQPILYGISYERIDLDE